MKTIQISKLNYYSHLLKRLFLKLATTFFIICSSAFGQYSSSDTLSITRLYEMTLEELMMVKVAVSATEKTDVFQSPSTVTVIDRDVLDLYNFQSVAEALEIVAGIEVYQTIIDRNVTTIRGIHQNFYANKILLLINRIPTWQPIYGDGHLERVNINDVERIEILKGPASVLYGSNAFSGVINIVLKESSETSFNGFGGVGLPNMGQAGINYSNRLGSYTFMVSASSQNEKRAGRKVRGNPDFLYNGDSSFVLNEEYANGTFNFQAKYGDQELFWNYFFFRHTYLGAHPSYAGGGGTMVDNSGSLLNYRLTTDLADNINFKLNIGYDYFKRIFPLSADRVNTVDLAGSRTFSDWVTSYRFNETLSLEVGVAAELRQSYGHDTRDALKDTLITHNLLKDDDIREWSAFSQVDARAGKFNVLMGSRFTKNQYFGDNVSSRVSAVYSIADHQAIKLIYGQAFRVPTMFELYFNHPTVVGNRDLKPELTTSAEFAFLTGFENSFFQTLIYYASYDDFIQRINIDSSPPSVYINADKFKTIGLEFELKYQYPKSFNSYINYNFIKGLNGSDNENFRYVPAHSLSFGINKQIKKFFLSFRGKLISSVNGHIREIRPQSLFDLSFGYTNIVNIYQLRHLLTLKNLTDSDYRIAEYIRKSPNVNSIATTAFGRSILYTLYFSF